MKVFWMIKQDQRRFFDKKGEWQLVSLLRLLPGIVIDFRRQDRDGYNALIIGWGEKPLAKMKKPQQEWLKKQGLKTGFKFIKEVRLDASELDNYRLGQEINLFDELEVGQLTKVSGVMKGRGFAGVVKRWGFAGGPRTHGQSDRERAPGSIGAGTTPGRVVKGKKMAGHYGNVQKTVTNLPILAIDKVNSLLLLKGVVPGSKGKPVRVEIIGKKKVNPVIIPGFEEGENGSN